MEESGDPIKFQNSHLAMFPELDRYKLKGVRKTDDCKRLGNWSFGVVDELYVQGTLCAAKHLHESLLDREQKELRESLVVLSRNVESWRVFDTQTLSSFLICTHFQIVPIQHL